jgi:crossover junction endodeoxyribonuclease RuvC
MFVLGIDPGLSRCGFGLVKASARGKHESVEYGVLQTPHTDPLHLRLASMMEQLESLFDRLGPTAVVVERVFFQTNARTAMGVGQASGLALALATRRGCQVHQYTANEVKHAVAGHGSAEKHQMQSMVAKLLSLDAPPKPADAADALGLALCHLASSQLERAAIGAPGIGAAPGRRMGTPGHSASGPSAADTYGGRPLRIATSVGGAAIASPARPHRSPLSNSALTDRKIAP